MNNTLEVKLLTIRTFVNQAVSQQDTVFFQGSGELVKTELKNRQDGTDDVVYNIKPKVVDIRVAKNDNEPKKRIVNDYKVREVSESQSTRQMAYAVAQETGDDPNDLYKRAQDHARSWLQEYSVQNSTPF